jgi:clan AA aspartic protease (TIGR02281 family)
MFNNASIAQNLSISETIDYINKKLSKKNKLDINKSGILTYIVPTRKNYLYSDHTSSDQCLDYKRGSKENRDTFNDLNYKTEYKIHISDLDQIKIIEPRGPLMRLCLEEWRVHLVCDKKQIFHKYKGDCIFYTKKGANPYFMDSIYSGYESNFKILTINGEKSTAEKINNALVYLINLAKEKGYDIKEDEEYDPFASNNFNKKQFEIYGRKDKGSVQLKNQNGVYYINVSISNITKKFILDTGASDVLISKEYERELIQKGFLKKEHYITDGLYRIADGSIIKCRRLLIPKLEIGGFIISNVKASVVDYGNTMLLGQSVLNKFSSWNIDNLTKTLELRK